MVDLNPSLLLALPPSATHRQRVLQTPDQIITMRRSTHDFGSLPPTVVGTPKSQAQEPRHHQSMPVDGHY